MRSTYARPALAPAMLPPPRRLRTSTLPPPRPSVRGLGLYPHRKPEISPDGHGPEVTRIRGQIFFLSDPPLIRTPPDARQIRKQVARHDRRIRPRRSAARVAVSRQRSRPVVRRQPVRFGACQTIVRPLPDSTGLPGRGVGP